MISEKLHGKIRAYVLLLERFADRAWYPPFVGLLAALDNLVLIIPNDGILISSSILTPHRWFVLALNMAIGSTVGALVLAALVQFHGLPWILGFYPSLIETKTWTLSMGFFEQYGLLLVFAVSLTPLMQHPPVILAGLAHTPLIKLAPVIFCARLIKFLILAYIGSHAPRLLKKMWGVKGELEDAGIKLEQEPPREIPPFERDKLN